MKVRKNLEAVFLAAAVMAMFAAYATAEVPAYRAAANAKPAAAAAAAAVVGADTAVIVVSHKRLSAAEKAALD